MIQKERDEIIARRLEVFFSGEILYRENPRFTEAITIWNGAVTQRPAMVVIPETERDVEVAVSWASEHGLPLSVLGGGHDWAGRALNDGGVVINMKKFKKISIDAVQKTAAVGGGVTVRELANAAAVSGFVAVTGTVGAVGFAGFTLGGGYGLLTPSYGLSIDNVVGANIILPDGRAVYTNENEMPDLFWAIRGGGGNFGVVTALHIRLHPARPVLAGMLLFDWREAGLLLPKYSALMSAAPDAFSALAGMVPGPGGTPTLFIVPCWNGDLAAGEEYITAIRGLGTPLMDQVAPMEIKDLLSLFDPYIVNGNFYALETRWLPELNASAVAIIDHAVQNRSSELSTFNMHHFHGAATRYDLSDSAFGIREPHFMVEIISTSTPKAAEISGDYKKWGEEFSAALGVGAFPGGYPNLLGPHNKEQIQAAYGRNLARLREVKKKYDVERMFNGIGIPL